MTTMRERRMNEYEDQGELLREEKQRVTELENQQHELITMVEELNELQRQSEQLREKEQQVAELRGVARGGPGVPVTPLGRPSFEQTTHNIQVAKTA